MCLAINRYLHPTYQPIKIKEDLMVYKCLRSDNRSPVILFKYERNTLYRLRKKFIPFLYKIQKGFHSFISKDEAVKYQGYDDKVVIMTIPKGAMVYYGDGMDIVSTSIRSGNLVSLVQGY